MNLYRNIVYSFLYLKFYRKLWNQISIYQGLDFKNSTANLNEPQWIAGLPLVFFKVLIIDFRLDRNFTGTRSFQLKLWCVPTMCLIFLKSSQEFHNTYMQWTIILIFTLSTPNHCTKDYKMYFFIFNSIVYFLNYYLECYNVCLLTDL